MSVISVLQFMVIINGLGMIINFVIMVMDGMAKEYIKPFNFFALIGGFVLQTILTVLYLMVQ